VVAHYNQHFGLALTTQESSDLVEHLLSLPPPPRPDRRGG
jgi:hypothetical protein